jgi:acetyl esterase/lipase
MKRSKLLLIGAVCLFMSERSSAQVNEVILWPNGAPGSEGKTGAEISRTAANGEHFLNNIHKPSITCYVPSPDKSTGIAVIIAPGGGHRELRIDGEGYLLAKKLQDKGIAAFVLKYRLANEPNATYTVDKDEVADIKRAIRSIKFKAKQWAIDTAKVGVMGFSAGGELAAMAAMRFDDGTPDASDPIDRINSRPAFQALIYPGNSKRFEAVKNMPPAFLAAGYKDRPDIAEGIVQVYLKYKQGGVKTDLHIYTTAGHGFAADENSKNTSSKWIETFAEWLADLGFFPKKG